jgi:hypothetical protein
MQENGRNARSQNRHMDRLFYIIRQIVLMLLKELLIGLGFVPHASGSADVKVIGSTKTVETRSVGKRPVRKVVDIEVGAHA